MSMGILAHVRSKSQTKGSARNILFNLAVHANECCGLAWPSISTEAHEVNITRRNLHYQHVALVEAGELVIHLGEGPYGTNLYQLAWEGVPLGAPSHEAVADLPHEKGCPYGQGGGAPTGRGRDAPARHQGVPPGAPKNNQNERENQEPIARACDKAEEASPFYCAACGYSAPTCAHRVVEVVQSTTTGAVLRVAPEGRRGQPGLPLRSHNAHLVNS